MSQGAANDDRDRRKSARSRLFMLVETGDGKGPLWAWDIGLGGLQCRALNVRFPGTYLDLKFRLPGSDEFMKVGGQVTSMDRSEDGSLSLGIRFCVISPRLQMATYRFLDDRRSLWDPKVIHATPEKPDDRTDLTEPFEALLLEAFASLRVKELRRPAFIRRGPSQDLENLSRILGKRKREAREARKAG